MHFIIIFSSPPFQIILRLDSYKNIVALQSNIQCVNRFRRFKIERNPINNI